MAKVQILIIKDNRILLQRPLKAFKEEGERMLLEAGKEDASIGEYVEWVDYGEGREEPWGKCECCNAYLYADTKVTDPCPKCMKGGL